MGAQIALFIMSILFTDGVQRREPSSLLLFLIQPFSVKAQLPYKALLLYCQRGSFEHPFFLFCTCFISIFPTSSSPLPFPFPYLTWASLYSFFIFLSSSTFLHSSFFITPCSFMSTCPCLPLSQPSCSVSLSKSAFTPSPSNCGTQLSDMAVHRIALTQSEFSMSGASPQSDLVAIAKQLLWSRNQGDGLTDRREPTRTQLLSVRCMLDKSGCLAVFKGTVKSNGIS